MYRYSALIACVKRMCWWGVKWLMKWCHSKSATLPERKLREMHHNLHIGDKLL